MFTGIIETVGQVRKIENFGTNRVFWIESPISSTFKPDQSVCHSGVCLTVEEVNGMMHRVTAIEVTLKKTNLGNWNAHTIVNIEQCLKMDGRLDGHIVQGHADTIGVCIKRSEKNGSWEFEFEFPKKFAGLIVEKGSVAVNGISLTAFNVKKKSFTVAIIPYTYEHTNISTIHRGDKLNIEFDITGKYILRNLELGIIK